MASWDWDHIRQKRKLIQIWLMLERKRLQLYRGLRTSVVMTALLWSEGKCVWILLVVQGSLYFTSDDSFVMMGGWVCGVCFIESKTFWTDHQYSSTLDIVTIPLILQTYSRHHKSFVGVPTLLLTAVPWRLLQCHWHGSSTMDIVAFLLTIWQTHQHLKHRVPLILCYFKYFASLWVNFMFSFLKWPCRLNCAGRYASFSVWWSGQLDDSCKFLTFSTKPLLHSVLHVIYTNFSRRTLLHGICLFDQLIDWLIDWLIDRSVTIHIWQSRKVPCLLYVGFSCSGPQTVT